MPDDTRRRSLLITGGSGGIGGATAVAAASRGWDVFLHYHRNRGKAEAVAEACRDLGAVVAVGTADIADPDAVARLFDRVDAAFPTLDGLVNNAGIIGTKTSLFDLRPETLQHSFATNVFGAVYCLQHAARRMRDAGGGVIVNISSIAATLGSPGEYVHYAAGKGALDTLTLGAAKELGPFGIRVNGVQAGTTLTDIHASIGNESRLEAVAKISPLGRVAAPKEIAEAVLWLCSDAASYTNGALLRVGGGL